MTYPALVMPQISLNGTRPRDLVDQQLAVVGALRLVQDAMSAATPHGRDYQYASLAQYEAARHAWTARQHAIIELRREIEKHAEAIDALSSP
jgi:hypothetical protein